MWTAQERLLLSLSHHIHHVLLSPHDTRSAPEHLSSHTHLHSRLPLWFQRPAVIGRGEPHTFVMVRRALICQGPGPNCHQRCPHPSGGTGPTTTSGPTKLAASASQPTPTAGKQLSNQIHVLSTLKNKKSPSNMS